MTCPACHADAPDSARYCPACGHDLRVRGDERRVVTVLFADLVGFTSLSETHDPEQVKNLVDRCFQRLVTDITAFGGQVDKIVGDGILALFGAPVAHEDDAERAVRTAIQMHATLAEVAGREGVDLRMRVGVSTGEVLVGALRAGGSTTAMGDVVNTASRLQTAAQPGEVLVGPQTYTATRRVVNYEAKGAVQAKGREEPVQAWVALEALLPPGYRPNRERAPLVGRDAEVGLLRHAVDAAVVHQRANLLLVLGEAGVGKSRLAEELASSAACDYDALVFEGRCVPYGEANVWWPVADALRHGCGIEPSDDEATARERTWRAVRAAVGTGSADADIDRLVDGLMHLMGFESSLRDIDATRAREEASWALITFVEHVARQRPVVVVLSDLHWADDVVLELVDMLIERLVHLRFVFVATARPNLEERWSPRHGRHNLVVLNLDPLGIEASRALLDELAGTELDDELAEVLLHRSGGNPFFLEELVALLAEAGVVGGHGPTPYGVPGVELPDTLRGLVAARLDALPPIERKVLDSSTVLGRGGPLTALATMAREAHGIEDWETVLESLVAKELILVEGDKWSFRSDLVREVAYGTLTKGDRARAHAGIAKWIEHNENHLHDAVIDQIANHYARAAELVAEVGAVDHVPADVVERALTWLERAAERAEQTQVPMVAARLHGEGLNLIGTAPSERRRGFLLGRARALAQLRDLAKARADVNAALVEAREVTDGNGEGCALLVLADIEQKDNHPEAADELLIEAQALFADLGDDAGRAEALRLQGFGALFRNDFDAAYSSLDAALELFQRLGDRRGEAWALQNLSWALFMTGKPVDAEVRLRQSAATFAELGDHSGLGWAMGLLAWTRFQQGFAGEAEVMAEQVLEDAVEWGDQWAQGMMLVLLSCIHCWTGRTQSAVERAREAVALFSAIGDNWGLAQAWAPLGRGLVTSGRVEEGFAEFDAMRAQLDPTLGDKQRRFIFASVLGTAVQVGDASRTSAVWESMPGGGDWDDHTVVGELLVGVALHALQLGDVDRALELLARHDAEFDGYGQSARALALAGAGRIDDALGCADTVVGNSRATYLDRTAAGIARALTLVQRGDAVDAEAALVDARDLVDSTEDRVGQALVRLAGSVAARVLDASDADERTADAAGRLADLGIEADGWRTAYEIAATAKAASSTR